MAWPNYLANWLFAFTGWLLVGVKSTDLHSGMRAYSRQLIQQVEVDPNGPALPVELLLKPALQGFRIGEVFIPYGERIGETTLQRWSSTLSSQSSTSGYSSTWPATRCAAAIKPSS